MKTALNTTSDALSVIRETCEQSIYQSSVSSTDKTSLDTQRTNINTALTNITTAQQTISTEELDQNAAQVALGKAQDELAELKAPARPGRH